MKIVIAGETYGLVESVNDASLGDLYLVKVKTKSDAHPGVSVKTITQAFDRIAEATKREGFSTLDLLDDEDFILTLQALVFLARRKNGEVTTWEAAGDVAFTAVELIDDEDDADPKGEPAEVAIVEG